MAPAPAASPSQAMAPTLVAPAPPRPAPIPVDTPPAAPAHLPLPLAAPADPAPDPRWEDRSDPAPRADNAFARRQSTESTRIGPARSIAAIQIAARRAMDATRRALAALLRSRRALALTLAAASIVLVVLVIAVTRRGRSTSPAVVAANDPPATAPRAEPPVTPAMAPSPTPVSPKPATAPRPTPAAPTATPEVPAPPAPPATPRPHRRKPVVVDYDTPKAAPKVAVAAATPISEDASLAKARAAYAAGNQRLFAGDADGAIQSYQQALDAYPGYAAGYRGLGLAYDQLGDKPKAIQSLRLYMNMAPAAKDVALIKKRLARLQAK
jgi:tetratricopeptide (TPR) repeat protein